MTTIQDMNAAKLSMTGEIELRVTMKLMASAQTVISEAQQKRMARRLVKPAMATRRSAGSAAVCSNHRLYLVFINVWRVSGLTVNVRRGLQPISFHDFATALSFHA